eukprot:COSAG02_NODE_50495_length_320_cov_0.696833_1_plen_52_part_10
MQDPAPSVLLLPQHEMAEGGGDRLGCVVLLGEGLEGDDDAIPFNVPRGGPAL